MNKIINKPEILFAIIFFIWGLLFLIINPPFQAPDENSHLYKIYGITEGSWNFKKYTTDNINNMYLGKKHTFAGQILPIGIIQAGIYNKRISFHPNIKTSFKENKEISQIKLQKDKPTFLGYSVPSYTPLSYFPAFIIIWIIKLFNGTPYSMLMCGRICSLIVYLTLVFFSIKTTPIKKWLFLTLALLPMSVYEAGALSTDAITIGLSFLFIAYSLKLAYDETIQKISNKNLMKWCILITLLSICKFTYFPLVFLFFIIPNSKFQNNKLKNFLLLLSIVFLVSFSTTLQSILVTKGITSHSSSLDKGELIKAAITHPINYFLLIIKTTFYNFNEYLNGFIGYFGWSDTILPQFIIKIYTFLLLITAFVKNQKEEKNKLKTKDKILLFFILLTSIFLIFSACYITFMPDDYTKLITGVQGRYFIPIALLFFLLFSNNKFSINPKILHILTLLIINFTLFISLVTIFIRFYI